MNDEGDEVEITGLVQAEPGLANDRLRVERFIREHKTHPTIARIKNNLPLHAGDIDSHEAILFANDGPGKRQKFIETYSNDATLGELVRKVVGLDRAAAKEALAGFFCGRPVFC